jgi:hypothetical protein
MMTFRELCSNSVRQRSYGSLDKSYWGTRWDQCNLIAREIWQFAQICNMWNSHKRIKRVACFMRILNGCYMTPFADVRCFLRAEIDLFASRWNAKLPKYISWKLDQETLFVAAFQLFRTDLKWYAFPPFSIIDRFTKTSNRQSSEEFYPTILEESTLVPKFTENVCATP